MNAMIIYLVCGSIFLIAAVIWWKKSNSISSLVKKLEKLNAKETAFLKSNVSRDAYKNVCNKISCCNYSWEREPYQELKQIEEADLEVRLKAEQAVLAEKVRIYRFGLNLDMMSLIMKRVRKETRLVEKIVCCRNEEDAIRILFNHVGIKEDDYNIYYNLMQKIVTNLKNN